MRTNLVALLLRLRLLSPLDSRLLFYASQSQLASAFFRAPRRALPRPPLLHLPLPRRRPLRRLRDPRARGPLRVHHRIERLRPPPRVASRRDPRPRRRVRAREELAAHRAAQNLKRLLGDRPVFRRDADDGVVRAQHRRQQQRRRDRRVSIEPFLAERRRERGGPPQRRGSGRADPARADFADAAEEPRQRRLGVDGVVLGRRRRLLLLLFRGGGLGGGV
mmetsp:Transcript_13916/g.49951  ORF Transcript_13916/g.49951 Transcript_13916/m.49951 type:complete len:220 (+) Transcript_13916:208-867(+)